MLFLFIIYISLTYIVSLLFFFFFFFNDTATTEIYTLSLHDALPIFPQGGAPAGSPRSNGRGARRRRDRRPGPPRRRRGRRDGPPRAARRRARACQGDRRAARRSGAARPHGTGRARAGRAGIRGPADGREDGGDLQSRGCELAPLVSAA